MRAVSITGHLGGHRSNAHRLTDIAAIRRCCRTWPFLRSVGYVYRLHSGPVVARWVLVGSSAGQALSLICTPHRGISRLIEISGWLW
jgi:hypothetical protein